MFLYKPNLKERFKIKPLLDLSLHVTSLFWKQLLKFLFYLWSSFPKNIKVILVRSKIYNFFD